MAAASRPRRPGESVDLGFHMARQWWRPLWGAWLLTVAPVFAAAAPGLAHYPGITFLALWWLQPLFDRVPLFVLSRCLFGDTPGWRQTLRALPRLWGRDLPGALLWRRFDPLRSFHLPVRQLERLPARQRWRRLHALGHGARQTAAGLTAASVLMQLGLLAALIMLIDILLPDKLSNEMGRGLFHTGVAPAPVWQAALWMLLVFLALSAIEPFYVAAGFALYLGQRTRAEGWDVEITLRRLAARLDAGAAAGARDPLARSTGAGAALKVLAMALAVGVAATMAPPPAMSAMSATLAMSTMLATGATGATAATGTTAAMTATPEGPAKRTVRPRPSAGVKRARAESPQEWTLLPAHPAAATGKVTHVGAGMAVRNEPTGAAAASAVVEVLHGPEFATVERQTGWRIKPAHAKDGKAVAEDADSTLADLPPLPLWARRTLLSLLVAFLLYLLVRWRGAWLPQAWRPARDAAAPSAKAAALEPPHELAGLDVRSASLPADVPAAAWELWEQGRALPALALLYRGALAALLAGGAVRFDASWTEGDCLREVLRQAGGPAAGVSAMPPAGGEHAGLFARLTAAWQSAAYAGRLPAAPAMRALCDGWGRHLGPLLPGGTSNGANVLQGASGTGSTPAGGGAADSARAESAGRGGV